MKQDQLDSLFDDAVATTQPARRPKEPIAREALLEPPYRYWLKRAWGSGPQIAWAMLNPSTADGLQDDPTMWRVMEFSLRWGFGSCVVVNIYPFQSSKPADMKKWRRTFSVLPGVGGNDEGWHAWQDNIKTSADLLTGAQARVAAWGAGADLEDVSWWLEGIHIERGGIESYTEQVMAGTCKVMDIGKPITDWLCLGTTKDGAPKHPLARGKERVPADFTPVPWSFPQ